MGSLGGGGASITSATRALGASVEIVSRVSSAADNGGGEEGLVFVSEDVASVGMGSLLASSGVFERGGGVGFPLSSGVKKKKISLDFTASTHVFRIHTFSCPPHMDHENIKVFMEPL